MPIIFSLLFTALFLGSCIPNNKYEAQQDTIANNVISQNVNTNSTSGAKQNDEIVAAIRQLSLDIITIRDKLDSLNKYIVVSKDFIIDKTDSNFVLYNIPIMQFFEDPDYKLGVKYLDHSMFKDAQKVFTFVYDRYQNILSNEIDPNRSQSIKLILSNIRYILAYINFHEKKYSESVAILSENIIQTDIKTTDSIQNAFAMVWSLHEAARDDKICEIITIYKLNDRLFLGGEYNFIISKLPTTILTTNNNQTDEICPNTASEQSTTTPITFSPTALKERNNEEVNTETKTTKRITKIKKIKNKPEAVQ